MKRIALIVCLAALPVAAAASDWPQFRGPTGRGTAAAEGLLESWAEGKPREVWRQPIGMGFSAISVAGERLYTLAAEGDKEFVLCLDAATGESLWRAPLGPANPELFPEGGPRATPTVDGDTVYAVSSGSKLAALHAPDGHVIWSKDLNDYGPPPRFGYSTSPLIEGDLLIIEVGKGDEGPGVVALDKTSGEERWQALEGPAGYSTPIVVEIDGVRQIVFFRRAGGEAVALSTEGEVLWRHPAEGALAIIVSPLFLPPNRIFLSTSDDTFGGKMLEVKRDGDGFVAEPLWSERLMRNHFNTAVTVDGDLYGFDNATLRAVDGETGERLWAKRGFGKGSLMAAGKLLFVLGDDGILALVHASREGYHETGRVRAMEGRAWTAPSLAGGRLYLRDADEIVAYDVGAGEGDEEATP